VPVDHQEMLLHSAIDEAVTPASSNESDSTDCADRYRVSFNKSPTCSKSLGNLAIVADTESVDIQRPPDEASSFVQPMTSQSHDQSGTPETYGTSYSRSQSFRDNGTRGSEHSASISPSVYGTNPTSSRSFIDETSVSCDQSGNTTHHTHETNHTSSQYSEDETDSQYIGEEEDISRNQSGNVTSYTYETKASCSHSFGNETSFSRKQSGNSTSYTYGSNPSCSQSIKEESVQTNDQLGVISPPKGEANFTELSYIKDETISLTASHGGFILSKDNSSSNKKEHSSTVQENRPQLDGNLYIVRSEEPELTESNSCDDVYEDSSGYSSKHSKKTRRPGIVDVQSLCSTIVSSATFDQDDGVMEAFDTVILNQRPVADSISSERLGLDEESGAQQPSFLYDDYSFYRLPHSTFHTDGESGIVASDESPLALNGVAPSIGLAFSCQSVNQEGAMSIPITPLYRIPYVHGSFASAAPMMLEDRKWMRILRLLMPESHADIIEVLKHASQSKKSAKMARIMKWAENNPVVAAYGILQSDCGKECSDLAMTTPVSSKDQDMEKSYFTSTQRVRRHHNLNVGYVQPISRKRDQAPSRPRIRPTIEWDVFLDPAIVKKAEEALEQVDLQNTNEGWTAAQMEVDRQISRLVNRMILAHGSASQLVSEAIGLVPEFNFSSIVEQAESLRLYRRKQQLGTGLPKNWKSASDYGGKSVHATVPDGAISNVPGKSNAKSAGIFIERWLRIFSRALQLERDGISLLDVPDMDDRDDEDMHMQQLKQPFCGMFLCLGYGDRNSIQTDHTMGAMAESAREISNLLGAQLCVILDLKSRRVPPRIWARLIDVMRSRGIGVEGIGSFEVDELRRINNACAVPVKKMRFFHSAGDLQKACHANEVEVGDTVFFNAGSLFATSSHDFSSSLICCHGPLPSDVTRSLMFHPYAYPRSEIEATFGEVDCNSTIEEYKNRFDLQIGLYVQEFSISQFAIESLVQFTNRHVKVYNLGLAWGGINGKTVRGLEGDGYWSQRYMGRTWDTDVAPTGHLELLQPLDHHFVQRAALAGAWGHLGTLNLAGDSKSTLMVSRIGACQSEDI